MYVKYLAVQKTNLIL